MKKWSQLVDVMWHEGWIQFVAIALMAVAIAWVAQSEMTDVSEPSLALLELVRM